MLQRQILVQLFVGHYTSMSFSVVDHLRWDLGSMFEMAVAEKVIAVNPATTLYTPKAAKTGPCLVMTASDVEVVLGAVAGRERLILRLAIFSGFRPGEMLALRRRHVRSGGNPIEVEQRIIGATWTVQKWKDPHRGYSFSTASMLCEWIDAAVESDPNAGSLLQTPGPTPSSKR